MTKIIIHVDGGNVQAVYSDGNRYDFEVLIVDFDNFEAEEMTRTEQEQVLNSFTENMTAIY